MELSNEKKKTEWLFSSKAQVVASTTWIFRFTSSWITIQMAYEREEIARQVLLRDEIFSRNFRQSPKK